jgi:sec-independent protein translocase protein TatA
LTGPRGGVTLSVMFGLGFTEILVIVLIIALLFGARRLPELGSGLGKAIKNFKAGVTGKDEIDVTPESEPTKKVEDETPAS